MLLITPQEVMTLAFSPGLLVDSQVILPSKISIAQEFFLRSRLGDDLFEALSKGEHADFTNRYLKAPLAYYVRYGLLDELSILVDSNGVIQRLGNQSQSQTSSQNTITKEHSQNDTKENTQTIASDQKTVESLTNQQSKVLARTLDSDTSETQEVQQSQVDVLKGVQTELDSQSSRTDIEEVAGLNSTTDTTQDDVSSKEVETNTNNTQTLTSTTKTTASTSTLESENTNTTTSDTQNTTQDQELSKTVTDASESVSGWESEQLAQQNDTKSQDEISYRPATIAQVQSLKLRAISDANTLLRIALRYVKNHPQEFGSYGSPSRFVM